MIPRRPARPRGATRLALSVCALAHVVAVAVAVAAPGAQAAPADDAPRGLAILRQFDELAAREVWPGFVPASIPRLVWDGGRSWLAGHPRPPAGYAPWPEAAGVFTRPGRDDAVRANTSTDVGGAVTATLMSGADSDADARALAAVLVHEAFHVHQDLALPGFRSNEALLFEQPLADAERLFERRAESEALRRGWLALRDDDTDAALGWAGAAVRWRRRRATSGDVTYERGLELREGLAQYVQFRAHDTRACAPIPAGGFAAEDVRERGYPVGEAWARLLDAAAPGWASALPGDGSETLDERLARALAGVDTPAPRELEADALESLRARAAVDAAAVTAARAARLEAYLSRPGTTVVLQPSGGALQVERFDPLNVEPLGNGQVLHTRWLVLTRGGQRVEVEGREALSLAAGTHPLFGGVAALVVTSLAEPPAITQDGQRLSLTAPGLAVELTGARLVREGGRLLVSF